MYIIGEQHYFHGRQRKLMLRLFSSAWPEFLSTSTYYMESFVNSFSRKKQEKQCFSNTLEKLESLETHSHGHNKSHGKTWQIT